MLTICPSHLRADAHKLRRVLINLLGNAAKFTDAGQIQLTIGLIDGELALATGEVHLKFEVRDSGIGIAPESQHQLFKPFSQIRSQQGRAASGSGLGLSISRHLVRMMGGDLMVASQLGQGATFTFDMVCQPAEPLALSEPREVVHRNGVGNRQPLHILVVDDSAVNQSLAKLMIERLGHTVETLGCGEEVLETIRNTHYDVILMDIHMGEVNGIEATCSIRRERQIKATLYYCLYGECLCGGY
ncbi:ATP-binding protein [Vibrio sp. PP-XX7]